MARTVHSGHLEVVDLHSISMHSTLSMIQDYFSVLEGCALLSVGGLQYLTNRPWCNRHWWDLSVSVALLNHGQSTMLVRVESYES